MTKREQVEFLLDHWQDFFETMENAYDAPGDRGGSLSLMPAMSRHPSVIELQRAIGKVRAVMPVRVQHMMGFYTAEWRTVDRPVKKRTKGGKLHIVQVKTRERVVPKWVRNQKVRDAVTAVTAVFDGPVFIPDELREPLQVAA